MASGTVVINFREGMVAVSDIHAPPGADGTEYAAHYLLAQSQGWNIKDDQVIGGSVQEGEYAFNSGTIQGARHAVEGVKRNAGAAAEMRYYANRHQADKFNQGPGLLGAADFLQQEQMLRAARNTQDGYAKASQNKHGDVPEEIQSLCIKLAEMGGGVATLSGDLIQRGLKVAVPHMPVCSFRWCFKGGPWSRMKEKDEVLEDMQQKFGTKKAVRVQAFLEDGYMTTDCTYDFDRGGKDVDPNMESAMKKVQYQKHEVYWGDTAAYEQWKKKHGKK